MCIHIQEVINHYKKPEGNQSQSLALKIVETEKSVKKSKKDLELPFDVRFPKKKVEKKLKVGMMKKDAEKFMHFLNKVIEHCDVVDDYEKIQCFKIFKDKTQQKIKDFSSVNFEELSDPNLSKMIVIVK